jgi:RND family efflux transporter MFP subunit
LRIRYILPLMMVLIMSACGKDSDSAPGKGSRTDDRQAVMVEELVLRDIDEYVRVSGKVEGITDIVMSSESAGRILALYKKLGDPVEQGERIGMVENEVLKIRLQQAEAAYQSAESSLENAQRNLDFATASRERNLISEAEYHTALSAFKGAQAGFDGSVAALESAQQAYENSYLRAAEKGYISQIHVAVGQYIGPGTPVVSITDASKLILKTGVGESQISKLKAGQSAIISHKGRNITGSVRGLGLSSMAMSSSYPVEILIPGGSGILPGMVVSARIKTNTYRKLLYTEIANLITEYDRDYLYVIGEQDDEVYVEKHEVSTGRSISEFVELTSGVEAGDRIVISGSENLEDGAAVKIRN